MTAEQARRELEALFRAWLAAVPGHDSAFFERTLSDDWYYTDVAGTVRGKREYIPYVAGVPPQVRLDLRDLAVRLFGELALVHGVYEIDDGAGGLTRTRFTAVWIRRAGGWQALTHHATAIAG